MNPTVLATTLATVMATSTLAARPGDGIADSSQDSACGPHGDDDGEAIDAPCHAETAGDAYRVRSDEAA